MVRRSSRPGSRRRGFGIGKSARVRARWASLRFEQLEPRLVLNGGPVITEFMADNALTQLDGDGAPSDWIEIYNPTTEPIDLTGWYLTDNDQNDDLAEWAFPAYQLDPGEYLLVFASNKPDELYPYYDAGGYMHTSFALSAGGESLALVEPDGQTVASSYWDYPEQVEDVSYGLAEGAVVADTLIGEGAAVRYHVPTPGDAPLMPDPEPGGDPGWTATGFDDSSWTSSVALDAPGLVITEVSTGSPHYVEIENVSSTTIDTNGWLVLVNDATGGINAVNSTAWDLSTLPGHQVLPGEVFYRTDDSGDNYWGAPIDWQTDGPGWVMIVDGGGQVEEFVAWGYTATQIAGLSVDFGAFSGITVGDQWHGAGAEVGEGGGEPEVRWTSFNDHVAGAGTHPNATTYAGNGTRTGPLKNIDTGATIPITLGISQSGVYFAGSQGYPQAGTPAYEIFDGYVDLGSGTEASIELEAGTNDFYRYTFSNLSTSDDLTYDFVGTAVRGRSSYYNRWTLVTLEGAASWTLVSEHAAGLGVVTHDEAPADVAENQVAVWTGYNSGPDQGFVAHWTDIDPGPDGQFAVRSEQYKGPTPGVGTGTANGTKGYGLSGIRLQQIAAGQGLGVLVRTGGYDSNRADDFVRTSSDSKGSENPELTVPFDNTAPAQTGIGFAGAQVDYDELIRTDVSAEMQGQNASLWLRIPFQVDDPSVYDTLTLKVKYDDGFVARLNGVKVAERYAPQPLQYNSAATLAHSQVSTYETIDLSGYLGEDIHTGTNVLAIQVLNVSAADADLLMLPELTASNQGAVPQYMANPTPGEPNVSGAMGLVEDTAFSVDRGFYVDPFSVEITTATPGADIYYTTDGTSPLTSSGGIDPAAIQYTAPVLIDPATEPLGRGAITLRAVAFKPGWLPSNVDTQTYIFPNYVAQQDGAGFPNTWGHAGADYQMDPDIINNPAWSSLVIDGLTAIPTLSLVMPTSDWFDSSTGIYPHGEHVEKAVSMELIYPAGNDVGLYTEGADVQVDAGVWVGGGSSVNRWKSDKLSMRVKFKREYGPGRLDFPVFGDDASQSFNTLVVDAGLNNVWTYGGGVSATLQRDRGDYIRDQFIADLQLAAGGYGPHTIPVHVYLNGLYWGVHRLHERPDDAFAADYLGGEKEHYDAIKHKSSLVIAGTNQNYLQMFSAVSAAAVQDRMTVVQQYLDVPDFIDYLIINYWSGNWDWDHQNWYATRNKYDPEGRWHYHSWDAEHTLEDYNDWNTRNTSNAPTGMHNLLKGNLEYQVLFADRLHRLFDNGGILSPEGAWSIYEIRKNELETAIVVESARWGDNRREPPYTKTDWEAEIQRLQDQFFFDFPNTSYDNRSDFTFQKLKSQGLYPNTAPPALNINGSYQHGGPITRGDQLTFSGTLLPIYYTLDGSDPRLAGGAISPAAQLYTGPITLADSSLVKARAYDAGAGSDFDRWSPLTEAVFEASTPPTLVITEINYNPYAPTAAEIAAGFTNNDDFEFIELENVGDQPVSLVTLEFVNGVRFSGVDAEVPSLAPGQIGVLVRNKQAFQQRYGTGPLVIGDYGTNPYLAYNLANNGERLELAHALDSVFLNIRYNDTGSWPGRADGGGSTLELIDPDAVPASEPERTAFLNDSENWRSSSEYGGTPGSRGAGPSSHLVVNEVLTHSDPPQTDMIELHNTTASDIIVGTTPGYEQLWLSDSRDDYLKFRIPHGTVIPAGGFVTFDESDFNPGGGTLPGDFALDGAHGEEVWLLEADPTGYPLRFVDHVAQRRVLRTLDQQRGPGLFLSHGAFHAGPAQR